MLAAKSQPIWPRRTGARRVSTAHRPRSSGDLFRGVLIGRLLQALFIMVYTPHLTSCPSIKLHCFRTQSHTDGYNEMHFEDENDQEMVHFHAQDMKTDVLNNRYRDIGNDEELKWAETKKIRSMAIAKKPFMAIKLQRQNKRLKSKSTKT